MGAFVCRRQFESCGADENDREEWMTMVSLVEDYGEDSRSSIQETHFYPRS